MIRMLPGLVFLAVAILLFTALVAQPQKDRPDFDGPLVGEALPKLLLVNAKSEDSALPKGKVTVINFFASWCSPCALEMDELAILKKTSGAQFVGIAWNDSPTNITPWLKKHGNPFDVVHYDPNGRAAIALGLRGIPETFVVDADGIVRYQLAGLLDATSREQLTRLVVALEAEHAR